MVPPPDHSLPPSLASIGSNELVLLEFQGSIETEGDYTGEIIGNLDMTIESKPTLRIGHHLLEGKIASLPKPLAVMRRTDSTSDSETPYSFDIVAIIRKKIIFSKRPTPIVETVSTHAMEAPKRNRAT
ncbi:hypothetical protein FRC20_000853 [Serendipita sp. 405]|nr:hypothetical protein FRC20_000853 [Serendipita sp. 405]